LLRIGLYELQRPLEKSDDWIWIVDHTSQVGTIRCLLIVGFRQSQWLKLQRPLEFQDLDVIALAPAETTTAEVTERQLRLATERTGNPRAILSDQGRDIQKAVRLFSEDHPSTSHVHDVKHKLALFLKSELENDPQWATFCKKLASVRMALRQSSLQFLSPPAMKTFARYMNLAEIVKWAVKTRKFLDQPISPTSEPLNIGELNIALKWLRDYDVDLDRWNVFIDVINSSLTYMRKNGFHAGAEAELRHELEPMVSGQEGPQRLMERFLTFVHGESEKAHPSEHLPASSEIIESLIGTGKRLEGQQSKGSFTKMILSMAAAVAVPTRDLIQDAFQTIKTKDVAKWVQQTIGVSMQAKRRRAFQ